MHERQKIVEFYDSLVARGERAALATVVCVAGSAYRREGAKMLVAQNENSVGTLSGGCLEADVAEHAGRALRTGAAASVVRYDTTAAEDIVWGTGLGCNGVIDVLIEPDAERIARLIEVLRASLIRQSTTEIFTVMRVGDKTIQSNRAKIGAQIFRHDDGAISGDVCYLDLTTVAAALSKENEAANRRVKLPDESVVECFVETIAPAPALIVFGAGADALPVVELAAKIGWRTTVVDLQARTATLERFAVADAVILARPEEIIQKVEIAEQTLSLVMTHNFSHDLEILRFLLPRNTAYIGMLGPKKRTRLILAELKKADNFKSKDFDLKRLHAPVGLDTGAETPEEIAVSIVAEMRAVLSNRSGGFLRERRSPIHETNAERVAAKPSFYSPPSPLEASLQTRRNVSGGEPNFLTSR